MCEGVHKVHQVFEVFAQAIEIINKLTTYLVTLSYSFRMIHFNTFKMNSSAISLLNILCFNNSFKIFLTRQDRGRA